MAGELERDVRSMMEAHWRPAGYTVPHHGFYPWQWLWDSCFHALVWARLGRTDRSRAELASVFTWQTRRGFVPHMGYHDDGDRHASFWGVRDRSTITQPPMYGHAVASLVRAGVEVDDELVERAARGLQWLLEHRRRDDGLVTLCHPWESGCDDSPRWDAWCPGGFSPQRWKERKGTLVASIALDDEQAAVANPCFEVKSAGFNALVVWNARELAEVSGHTGLREASDPVAAALATRWDATRRTWRDDASSVATADALLPLLVLDDPGGAFDALVDPDAFAAPYGVRGVARHEPAYRPDTYWRGPVWPQLAYLLWVAARRAGRDGVARAIASGTRRGAVMSGLAEYWHPETGQGLGAIPQSWTGLTLLME